MHYLSAPGNKNMEIEIHKKCFAYYVPDCHIRHYTLVGIWHFDQQLFDYSNQYCGIGLFDNNAGADIQEQGK